MVCGLGHGRVARDQLCGGGQGPAVPLPGPGAGAQAGAVRLLEAEMGGSVRRRFRSAAVRPDEHVLRRGDGTESQGPARIQPGRQAGLPAVGDCAGGHARRVPAGLRSDERQHGGQHYPADVPGPDRGPLRPGPPDLADGPRHPHRGPLGGAARPGRAVSRRHAEGAAQQTRAAAPDRALAGRPAQCPGEALAPGRGVVCLGPEHGARGQGARHAPASIEAPLGATARLAAAAAHLRDAAVEAGGGPAGGGPGRQLPRGPIRPEAPSCLRAFGPPIVLAAAATFCIASSRTSGFS